MSQTSTMREQAKKKLRQIASDPSIQLMGRLASSLTGNRTRSLTLSPIEIAAADGEETFDAYIQAAEHFARKLKDQGAPFDELLDVIIGSLPLLVRGEVEKSADLIQEAATACFNYIETDDSRQSNYHDLKIAIGAVEEAYHAFVEAGRPTFQATTVEVSIAGTPEHCDEGLDAISNLVLAYRRHVEDLVENGIDTIDAAIGLGSTIEAALGGGAEVTRVDFGHLEDRSESEKLEALPLELMEAMEQICSQLHRLRGYSQAAETLENLLQRIPRDLQELKDSGTVAEIKLFLESVKQDYDKAKGVDLLAVVLPKATLRKAFEVIEEIEDADVSEIVAKPKTSHLILMIPVFGPKARVEQVVEHLEIIQHRALLPLAKRNAEAQGVKFIETGAGWYVENQISELAQLPAGMLTNERHEEVAEEDESQLVTSDSSN